MVSAAFKYCTSHKQQRRPMPSLLSLSFFYGAEVRTSAWGAKSNHVLFSLLHVIVECSVLNNKWHWLGLKKICSPCSPCRIRPIFSGSGFDLQMTYLPMNYSSKLGNSSRPPTLFETSNIVAYTPTITTKYGGEDPFNLRGVKFLAFLWFTRSFNSLLPNVA